MKREYTKPMVQTVVLKQRTMLLTVSTDENGMNKHLFNDEEVDGGW